MVLYLILSSSAEPMLSHSSFSWKSALEMPCSLKLIGLSILEIFVCWVLLMHRWDILEMVPCIIKVTGLSMLNNILYYWKLLRFCRDKGHQIQIFVSIFWWFTLSGQVSSPASSVWSKTTLNTGGVGGAGAGPPTCKTRTFFLIPLALTMPIINNFQLNGAPGETFKLWLL